jgi:hypothetical protein
MEQSKIPFVSTKEPGGFTADGNFDALRRLSCNIKFVRQEIVGGIEGLSCIHGYDGA